MGFTMSTNPLTSKIAIPYARALYDFSIEKNIMHQITADFQNLEEFINKTPELTNYLNNPLISLEAKREILTKILKPVINIETFKFLIILINKQKNELIKKLKELTKAREIRLVINIDPSLIGGFLIKNNSKVIDFTIKNQLQKLANHLDTILEI